MNSQWFQSLTIQCPSCGWDETIFWTEEEVYECPKCNWVWDSLEDEEFSSSENGELSLCNVEPSTDNL